MGARELGQGDQVLRAERGMAQWDFLPVLQGEQRKFENDWDLLHVRPQLEYIPLGLGLGPPLHFLLSR